MPEWLADDLTIRQLARELAAFYGAIAEDMPRRPPYDASYLIEHA